MALPVLNYSSFPSPNAYDNSGVLSNIDTKKDAVGMTGILFTSAQDLREKLESIL